MFDFGFIILLPTTLHRLSAFHLVFYFPRIFTVHLFWNAISNLQLYSRYHRIRMRYFIHLLASPFVPIGARSSLEIVEFCRECWSVWAMHYSIFVWRCWKASRFSHFLPSLLLLLVCSTCPCDSNDVNPLTVQFGYRLDCCVFKFKSLKRIQEIC